MKVKVIKEGCAPTRATDGAIGYDLRNAGALQELQEGDSREFGTGIMVELRPGQIGLIWPRSGLGFRKDIIVLAGAIDRDYRGEVQVKLHRLVSRELLRMALEKIVRWVYHAIDKHLDCAYISSYHTIATTPVELPHGAKIAQMILIPDSPIEFVDELTPTTRGSDGFGSTGV